MDAPNIGALWQCLGRLSGRQNHLYQHKHNEIGDSSPGAASFSGQHHPGLLPPTKKSKIIPFLKAKPPQKAALHPENSAETAMFFKMHVFQFLSL